MALLVFFAISIASALGWHRLVHSYSSAVLGATITTVLLFQLAVFLQLGYLDAFAPIAALVTAVAAAAVSAILGLPFRTRRKAINRERGAA
jgi:hypothetical protein